MPKNPSPLDIMNTMAGAAHKKAQPDIEPDEDDLPAPKSGKNPKQAAAINAKKKGYEKAPKLL